MVRRLVAVLSVVLFAGLLSPVAVVAQVSGSGSDDDLARAGTESPGVIADLPKLPDPWESDLDLTIPPYEPSVEESKPGLPVVSGSVTLGADKSVGAFANLPLSVSVDRSKAAESVKVDVAVL